MFCPQCNFETFIDHVEQSESTTTYVYVCMNPKCPAYKRSFTLTGAEMETQIQES
jgi:hypothetical protein